MALRQDVSRTMLCLALLLVLAPLPSTAAPVSTWMKDNWDTVQNRTLLELTLPGTHDSGAYNLTTLLQPGDSASKFVDELIKIAEDLHIPINDIITPWGKAQDKNFYGQLSGGIRYIDFRAGYNGSEWNSFHFEIAEPCQVLLNDIKRFLDGTTHEVIVVEVSHTGSAPQAAKQALAKMIVNTIGQYLLPRAKGFIPVGDMVTAGQRALFTLDDDTTIQGFPELFSGGAIRNSYADSPVLDTMVAYNDKQVAGFQTYTTPNSLYKISWTLTPNADAILKGFEPGKPHSLIELADTAAPVLQSWSSKYIFNASQPLANIVIIDHFETSPIVSVCTASSALTFPKRSS